MGTSNITYGISSNLKGGYTISDLLPQYVTPLVYETAPVIPWWPQITGNDPIDLSSGAYLYDHDDITVGSAGFPIGLNFHRSYTSNNRYASSPLGLGWSHGFAINAAKNSDGLKGMGQDSPIDAAAAIAEIYVAQDLLSDASKPLDKLMIASLAQRWFMDRLINNTVNVTLGSQAEQFVLLADGTYHPQSGSSNRLTLNSGAYTLQQKDGTALAFNSAGNIATWTNPAAVTVSFGYDASSPPLLTTVTNNLGRGLTLSYGSGKLTGVSDGTGRSAGYVYDAAGNLTSFTDPLGASTTYAYTTPGLLTQVFYPSQPSIPFVTNTYDTLGRVSSQANASNASGNNTTWNYYFAGYRSEEDDAYGKQHVLYWNPRGKSLFEIQDAAGLNRVTTNAYDGLDRLTSTTQPEGNSVAYAYDATLNPWANNVASITRNAKPGSTLSPTATNFAYDPLWNKPVSVTDALGRVSTASYDAATGHFNAKSTFTYNGYGQVLTATDPPAAVTAFAYDTFGNLVSRTADSGRLNLTTGFGYDTTGNLTTLTDPRGNMTAMTYDANRRLITGTAPAPFNAGPLLARTTNSYDADGHLTSVTRANGATDQVTSTAYTPTGKARSVTDPNGNQTTYAYDLNDRLASVTQPASGAPRVTSFAYDALGRTTAVSNTAIQAGPLEQTAYTANGQQASFTDANGNVTRYGYDGFDRLARTTYAQGTSLASSEAFTYDANDNTTSKTTRRNDVIAFSYDTLNRRTAMTPPAPTPAISYSYDLAGRLTGTTSNGPAIVKPVPPSGGTVQYATTLTYDPLNRPTQVSWDPAATQTAPTQGSVTFTHGYNAANQRVSQGVSDSTWISYPGSASSTTYTANALNQYTAVGTITPTYDQSGNLAVADTFDAVPTATAGTTNYVTDPEQRMVLEYNGTTGAIENWYAYGLGSNEVLNRMDVAGGTRQTLIPDVQGSTVATLDSGGTLAKRGYLPFGEGSTSTGSFAYTGQYLDNSGLYNYRARVYSAALSRFLQPDPIGYAGGRNLYAYVGNDPLNAVDPSGLYWFRQPWQTQFVVGRPDTLVEEGGPVSRFIENHVPAGRTFGEMHDRFVDVATKSGIPDWLANIPSMIPAYGAAVGKEVLRSLGILEQPTPAPQPTPPVQPIPRAQLTPPALLTPPTDLTPPALVTSPVQLTPSAQPTPSK